jgi:hypothetical protein
MTSIEPAKSEAYDIKVVRKLIKAAFTAEDLRRFCRDGQSFDEVLDYFGVNASLVEMTDAVIEYCLKRDLIPKLVEEISADNPNQYRRFRLLLPTPQPGPRYSNLPQPDYEHFVGRREQLGLIHKLLA